MQRKQFKVLAPIEKADGGTWWMKCGNGFENKDFSINLHIDSLPTSGSQKGGLKLQIRELTPEEMREREEKRASYQMRHTAAAVPALAPQTAVPF